MKQFAEKNAEQLANDGLRLISIPIPADKVPGDEFTYVHEELGEMEVVVPEDHKGGDTMELLLDEDDGEDIGSVEVDLTPHCDVNLNLVTFALDDDEVGLDEKKEEGEGGGEGSDVEEDDDEDETDGTNFMVWPAGIKMAEFVVSPAAKVLIKDKTSMLELGSGCGITGLATAAALARDGGSNSSARAILTDLPVALPVLTGNIRENEEAVSAGSGLKISAAALAWGDDDQAKEVLGAAGGSKFDLIVGSDLLYSSEKDAMLALSKTIDSLLDPETGTILMATRWREYDEERVFFEEMERLGYEFVLASQRSEALGGSVEEVEDPDGKECALPWQEFGSEKSEASKNYFAETKFEVNGEERCLSEVGPEDLLGMEEGDFDKYELTHVQIYAGYKK